MGAKLCESTHRNRPHEFMTEFKTMFAKWL